MSEEQKDIKNTEPEVKKKKPFLVILLIASIVLIGFGLYNIIKTEMNYKVAVDEYEELAEYVIMPTETPQITQTPEVQEEIETEPEQEKPYFPVIQINEEGLRAINPDYRCWMLMPCMGLCYPIVQGDDNDFYLTHTYEGTYNSAGCLFEDYINAPDFSDKNTYIYGHNMRNESMFGCLKRLRKEEGLCDSNPYIYMYEGNQVTIYRIFSYYVTETANYNKHPEEDRFLLIADEETVAADDEFVYTTYEDYLQRAFDLSEYTCDLDVNWEEQPNMITLSTCHGASGTTQRFLVHAVSLGTYNTKE